MSAEFTVYVKVHVRGEQPSELYAELTVQGDPTAENIAKAIVDMPALLARLHRSHYTGDPT